MNFRILVQLAAFAIIEFQIIWHTQRSHKRFLEPATTILTPQEIPRTVKTEVLHLPTIPVASSQVKLLCVVMREPSIRPLDNVHPNCHFFDVSENTATWWGSQVKLPCQTYTSECYTKKLAILFVNLLKTNYTHFYYVESDHTLCVHHNVIERLAYNYMVTAQSPQLITTGIGASGWLCTRTWASKFLENLKTCKKWLCGCPDCIAALMALPRATTRVMLTQHSIQNKIGLNKNNKLLPRCFQKRTEYGLNKFDFFDHSACHLRDISPCTNVERNLFVGH